MLSKLLSLCIGLSTSCAALAALPLAPQTDETPTAVPAERQYLFVTQPNQVPFRIPAIAQAKNGNLIAVSDYRPCGADIGFGEVDLVARISKDNGRTWGAQFTIADGTGQAGTAQCGYGDAAIVADSQSNEVLLLCVNGHTTYWNANYLEGRPNPVSLLRSHDGGETWSAPIDITEQIYGPFRASQHGAIKSLFFGSGRIVQSRRIKVGTHFRIYAAVAARDRGNRVFFSDDFGRSWAVLGGVDALPCPQGDEPKVEELPNGDVVLSSRNFTNGHNRFFNVFSFRNPRTAEGSWAEPVLSQGEDGVVALQNNTNGEILIVPARRKSDGARVHLVLQSVPFGPGRSKVGIYYKALAPQEVVTPSSLAQQWEGKYLVSTLGSAYSTMILQQDGRIGFFYEESTFGADYTEVYQPLNLETITAGAYSLRAARRAQRLRHNAQESVIRRSRQQYRLHRAKA